jgi:Tol biopolymer transport system component
MLALMRRLVPTIVAVLGLVAVVSAGSGVLWSPPAWATFAGRNGSLIVVASRSGPRNFYNLVEAVNPLDHRARTLLYCSQDGDDCPYSMGQPAVSPNGAQIAFSGTIYTDSYTTDSAIVLMSASGGQISDVPFYGFDSENDDGPAWYPTGDQLLFTANGESDVGPDLNALVSQTPSGHDPRVVLQCSCDDAAVSPNGQTILYNHDGSVWQVNADGSDPTELLPDATDASWGPGGLRFTAQRGPQVIVAGANGTGVREIATGINPVFSPQGDSVAFARFRRGRLDLLTVDARGGKAHRVFSQRIGPVGSFAGLAWQSQ